MKHSRLFGVGIILLFLVGFTACSATAKATQQVSLPATATTEATTELVNSTQANSQSTEAQQTEVSPAETPTIDVEALILEKLQNHHGIDRVLGAKHTREEWNATLDRMIGYGAKINEEEKKIIIDYLLSR